jgi:hypothetical protein
MSLFLLVLGAATTAAGFILVASGVVLPEGTIGVEVVTPGTIAAVGGLILVGIGLAVRQLQHIERALAGRPGLRPVPHEAPALSAAKLPAAAGRLPFPPKIPASPNPPPLPRGAMPTPAPAEVAALESPPAISPILAPFEDAPVVEDTVLPLIPQTPVHADEGIHEVKDPAVIGRGGNGARPIRQVPRVVARGRQSTAPDVARGAVLNAFWPDKSRAGNGAASADAASSTPQPPPVFRSEVPPAPVAAMTPVPQTEETEGIELVARQPISILKSGVVEGMAYSLYSDGSIEAELPQGTLRFGSIEALRNHIESSA